MDSLVKDHLPPARFFLIVSSSHFHAFCKSFDDVTLLIFVIALSEYDLVCEEDNTTNRLDESLKLFDEMVNNKYFSKTNVCIFFNKNDLFVEKVGFIRTCVCAG